MKAIWNCTIAKCDETIELEGNHYFPETSVNPKYVSQLNTKTYCSWKVEASYYNTTINSRVNREAAWYYPTLRMARSISRGMLHFRGEKKLLNKGSLVLSLIN